MLLHYRVTTQATHNAKRLTISLRVPVHTTMLVEDLQASLSLTNVTVLPYNTITHTQV